MALGQLKKDFQNLALGWNPVLPPRAMDPDAGLPFLYTDSLNYLVRDGRLQRRPVFVPADSTLQPTTTALETVMWCGVFDTTSATGDPDYCTIIVTNVYIWLKPSTTIAWKNVTPTYNTGTVTATNGSATVTGAGTTWSANKISRFSSIRIDGNDYTITNIASDTSITITPNFSGTTAAGKSYVITRNFGAITHPYFVTVFNQNLYVAGDGCGGQGIGGGSFSPAVIKVANIFSSSPTTSYITANLQLSPGLDNIGLSRVAGLAALQDGRIVVAGAQNTIFYSSLLNDSVWTSSPGGNTPIILINGQLNALGQLDNNLTLHHNLGIVWGIPTGQADPPLRFQASSASEGAYAPRTLKALNGEEFFVTNSGSIKKFTGTNVVDIGDTLRPTMRPKSKSDLSSMFAGIDYDRQEYILFQPAPGSIGKTIFWHYSMAMNSWFQCSVGAVLGAMSDSLGGVDFGDSIRSVIGLKQATSADNMLAYYKEATPGDTISIVGPFNGAPFFVTDDSDLGDALSKKTIQRVIIWADHLTGSQEQVYLGISRDQGASFTTVVANMMAAGQIESIAQFCFEELAPGGSTLWRFKFGIVDNNNTTIRPLRMLVIACESGGVDMGEL